MYKLLAKLSLLIVLVTNLQARDSDVHGYYQIIAGYTMPYQYTDQGGFGMRIAFPVKEELIYFGLMFDLLGHDFRYASGHLGLSLDLELSDSLYFVGNYGFAATSEGNTTLSTRDGGGSFYDLGLQYQFSEYIGVDLRYRRSDLTINALPVTREEVLYSLNIAITRESTAFFRILLRLMDIADD